MPDKRAKLIGLETRRKALQDRIADQSAERQSLQGHIAHNLGLTTPTREEQKQYERDKLRLEEVQRDLRQDRDALDKIELDLLVEQATLAAGAGSESLVTAPSSQQFLVVRQADGSFRSEPNPNYVAPEPREPRAPSKTGEQIAAESAAGIASEAALTEQRRAQTGLIGQQTTLAELEAQEKQVKAQLDVQARAAIDELKRLSASGATAAELEQAGLQAITNFQEYAASVQLEIARRREAREAREGQARSVRDLLGIEQQRQQAGSQALSQFEQTGVATAGRVQNLQQQLTPLTPEMAAAAVGQSPDDPQFQRAWGAYQQALAAPRSGPGQGLGGNGQLPPAALDVGQGASSLPPGPPPFLPSGEEDEEAAAVGVGGIPRFQVGSGA